MALSPTSSRSSGGSYTPPTASESLTGNGVLIANGANASLTWDTSFGPDVLLSLSNTAVPSVLTAGIYAVSLIVIPGALTAGGSYTVGLELDSDGTDATVTQESTGATAAVPSPFCTVTCVAHIPAAGTIRAKVRNHDGVSAVTFDLAANVQKVT